MSMIDHFKDMLTEGELPSDPFNEATERVSERLSKKEKEAMRKTWNQRLEQYFTDRDEQITINKMFAQKAHRTFRHRK